MKESTTKPTDAHGIRKDPVLPPFLQKLKTWSYWEEREFLPKDCTVWRGWNRKWPGERDTAMSPEKLFLWFPKDKKVMVWNNGKGGNKNILGETGSHQTKQGHSHSSHVSTHSLTLSHAHSHKTPLSPSLWGQPIATWPPSGGAPKLSSSCPWGVPKREVWEAGGEVGWKAQGAYLPSPQPLSFRKGWKLSMWGASNILEGIAIGRKMRTEKDRDLWTFFPLRGKKDLGQKEGGTRTR